MEADREGIPQNVSFDSAFLTGERVQPVKMNFFIEKSGNDIFGDDAKMLWMSEARIRTFLQLELEVCLEEINWMIRRHNCEALNCSQEDYPAWLLPIPPNYIDNLQRRLVKVNKGVLPPTFKMILKTRYHLPAPTTSITVHPDDTMGGHRDGENSPQERPRASEEEEKVVAKGTPSTNEGEYFIS